jgi:hypothetical protein
VKSTAFRKQVRGTGTLPAVTIALLVAIVFPASMSFAQGAAKCGDADLDGDLRLNDAVRIFRTVARLTVECPPRVCDVRGTTPGITLLDAQEMLRVVAGVDAESALDACRSPGVTDRVDQADNGGEQGSLHVGAAPIPGFGASQTIAGCNPDVAQCAQDPEPVNAGQFASLQLVGASAAAAAAAAADRVFPAGSAPCASPTLYLAVPVKVCRNQLATECLADADCPTGTGPCDEIAGAAGRCALETQPCTIDADCVFPAPVGNVGPCLGFVDGFYEIPMDAPGALPDLDVLVNRIIPAGVNGGRFDIDLATCDPQNGMSAYTRLRFDTMP